MAALDTIIMAEKLYTLEEAKQLLRDNWEKGIECPCCTQFVKAYKNPLFAASAFALIRLYQYQNNHPDEEWMHVKDFAEASSNTPRAGHFAELRFWGLIEEKPNEDDPTKRTIGFWRITPRGRDFVEQKIRVFSHGRMFNGKNYGFTGEHITISEALGNKFNYEELMSA